MPNIIEKLSDLAWGPFTLLLLIVFGGWITFKSRALYIIKAPFAVKKLIMSKRSGDVTPFMVLCNTLAATMGTGNIVGVATAVAAGGPGALFWMQVAAVFGMMIKFSEAALAVKFSHAGAGPMGYLKEIKLIGRPLAVMFALLCASAAAGAGCMTQSNSAAGALSRLSISPVLSAALFGLAALIAIGGGVKGIMKLSVYAVPFITVGYIAMSAAVIIKFRTDIPGVLADAVRSAFCIDAVSAGTVGYTAKQAIRYGIARGIFSNEAGMGTSAIAYSLSCDNDMKEQGMLAVAEVFIDTVICCSLTGIVLLLSDCRLTGTDGAKIAADAFSSALGSGYGDITAIFIALFGIASVCGWFTFGSEAVKMLSGGNKLIGIIYRYIYALSAAAGAVISSNIVWALSDAFTGMMLLINMFGLLMLKDKIIEIIST